MNVKMTVKELCNTESFEMFFEISTSLTYFVLMERNMEIMNITGTLSLEFTVKQNTHDVYRKNCGAFICIITA